MIANNSANKKRPNVGLNSNAVDESNKRSKNDPATTTTTTTTTKTTHQKEWSDLKLKSDLLRGIKAMGFEHPSAIQQRAIEPIMRGRDLIAQSQSGTGKTAAFAIGSLQIIKEAHSFPQVLILSPTRELAEQSGRVLNKLSDFMKNVKVQICVGGTLMKEDVKGFKNCNVISGTPGRVYDTIKKNIFDASGVSLLVIDEADEMITSGLKTTILEIYNELQNGVQVVLISATMSSQVISICREILNDPVKILVKQEETSVKAITQYRLNVQNENQKFSSLCDLYANLIINQAVVFCNTKSKVDWLSEKLIDAKFAVSKIHGGMTQKERDSIMTKFRLGNARILVTTDLWGRGIDVQQVSIVVNYDVPISKELYIHRIGRGGRFGRIGLAVTFVSSEDEEMMRQIQRFYKMDIGRLPKLSILANILKGGGE